MGCIHDAPGLARAADEWEGKIAFIGVIPDVDGKLDEQAVADHVDRFGLSFPQVRDRNLALTRRFGVRSTPAVVVLGPHQQLLYRGAHPPEDWGSVSTSFAR